MTGLNPLYLSVLKHNTIRYRRCTIFWMVWLIFSISLIIGLVAAKTPHVIVSPFYLLFSFLWIVMHTACIWQFGWAVGNVDPMTSMHTDKFKHDRLFLSFMTCLPLSRQTHFLIQLLLFLMISGLACLVSLFLHLLTASADGNATLVFYLHLLMFAIVVFMGGLHTVGDLSDAFLGEINSWKHPIVIKGYIGGFVAMMLIMFRNQIANFFGPEADFKTIQFITTQWWIILILLLAGALLFWRGLLNFSKADIK